MKKVEIAHQTKKAGINVRGMKKVVQAVMQDTDKGRSVEEIAARHGIDKELAKQICRLYLTHPGVSADGILGKMGL